MTIQPIVDQAEQFVRELATEMTRVRAGECLCCYVWRQLCKFGCDNTHRHAVRFRDARAPRHTALEKRLASYGACCCDCELFVNAYEPASRFGVSIAETEDERHLAVVKAGQLDQLPPCAGVLRGSVEPCGNWVRQWRRW